MSGERPYREDRVALSILGRLMERPEGFTSGADLSRTLRVSRNTVWKHVRRLRALGCVLEGKSARGYRVTRMPDSLRPEFVQAGLRTKTWGRSYRAYETLGSTNDACQAWAREGAPAGSVVAAEAQTQGRGRLNRSWFLPKSKSLAFSILLRPKLPPGELPLLTLASAVGVALAMGDEGLSVGIKWPNDVEWKGRKLCGILTEAQADLDRLQYAVVGIGINVNAGTKDFPPDLRDRAASLSQALGQSVDRPSFLRKALERLEEVHGWLESGRSDRMLTEWRARSTVLGHQVRIRQGDRTLYGQAQDVDAQGALLVRNDVGMVERVTAGDVDRLRLEAPRTSIRRAGTGRRRPV